MEYIFYILVVALVVGYLIDPKGFKTTGKRIVTIVRSNIESGVPVKQIEPSKEHDEWTQKFKEIENPPSAALKPVEAPKKHAIVQHRYKNTSMGLWPEWVCKCGTKGATPCGIYSDAETHRQARVEGEKHVYTANLAEERMDAAKGKDFAW